MVPQIISGQQATIHSCYCDENLLFYFVASKILKGQVLGVWDVRNCVKITKSPFLSPFYIETRVSKGEETYKG